MEAKTAKPNRLYCTRVKRSLQTKPLPGEPTSQTKYNFWNHVGQLAELTSLNQEANQKAKLPNKISKSAETKFLVPDRGI